MAKRTKLPPQKEMEYEEAPSGFVKLYNYKEPFMKFEGGFGFQGVLLFDGESDKIQCHLCGKWFDSLGGHLTREHNMYASDYKETVGLFKTTALINDKVREKLIANGQSRFKNLKIKNRKGTTISAEVRAKISKTLLENANKRERENMSGTCPAQLLAKLHAEYERLGYTPLCPDKMYENTPRIKDKEKMREYIESSKRLGSLETYIRVFGSWKKALEMANIPYRKPGTTTQPKWTKERALSWMTDFIDAHGKEPKIGDLPDALNGKFKKGILDKSEILKEAWIGSKNTKGTTGVRYSKEQLIKFLQNFENVNGRQPTYSDAKRGLIPHLSRYSCNFGSWKKALEIAFPKK